MDAEWVEEWDGEIDGELDCVFMYGLLTGSILCIQCLGVVYEVVYFLIGRAKHVLTDSSLFFLFVSSLLLLSLLLCLLSIYLSRNTNYSRIIQHY